MTFDHNFAYSFPLFSSLLNKEGRRKGECIVKIVIKSHAFLFDLENFACEFIHIDFLTGFVVAGGGFIF